jgi:F-type H+-transporting ATPase subunit epsilon
MPDKENQQMADTFLLDLVTPERTLFSGTVQELVAPGVLGEFGVLAGHANMLAELTAGRLVYKDESGEKLLAAAGGFAEVTGDRVTVLLDDAVYAEDLDGAALGKEIEDLEAQAPDQDEERYADWQDQLRWKTACREIAEQR